MATKIIIEVDGIREVHATHYTGNYASLCGLDGDDIEENQVTIGKAPKDAKINCKECRDIIIHARIYTPGELEAKR